MELTSITPDPSALRALSHPTRLRMLGILRTEGPATATLLATRLGINTGQTSYHLRQLAQHGFVVDDADRGNGRERWWRAAHQSTQTGRETGVPEDREALDAYLQAVAVLYTRNLQAAVEERPLLPMAWRRASTFSDVQLRLTPDRAKALVDTLMQTAMDYPEDAADDPDAADLTVQLQAFPRPGQLGGGDPT